MKDKLYVDARWIAPHGLGRYAKEVIKQLPNPGLVKLKAAPLHVLNPLLLSFELLLRQPKIYFTPGFNPPLLCLCPVIFTIGDLIHLNINEEKSFFKYIYYTYFLRFSALRSKSIVTFSEFSKNQIVKYFNINPKKVIVIGCGVGEEFSPYGEKHLPDYKYFFYVGNRKPHKNIPRILIAFSQANISKDFKLVLSGNPDSSILDTINSLQIENRIVFTGFISDEDLPKYYRGAFALIFPSLFEGFGLPPLEAMACGTPVITSNVTSLPEVVGNAALMVDPLSVSGITSAIEKLVEDKELHQQLIVLGLERAKKFSWDKTADLLKSVLFEELVNNGGSQ
jgi:glycosyltransferase involved in cell wall biosynthesis